MSNANTNKLYCVAFHQSEGEAYAVEASRAVAGNEVRAYYADLAAIAALMQLDRPTVCAVWYVEAACAGEARLMPWTDNVTQAEIGVAS